MGVEGEEDGDDERRSGGVDGDVVRRVEGG